MKAMMQTGLAGLGVYLPQKVVHADEIKDQEGLTDEYIDEVGIYQIHQAEEMGVTEMAIEAARAAIKDASIRPEEIDVIIFSSVYPDYLLWADYAEIQHQLGATNAYSFKLEQNCSSVFMSLDYAISRLETDPELKTVLIVVAQKYLPVMNPWTGGSGCFFGDGASAAIVKRGVESNRILAIHDLTDGRFHEMLLIPVGGTREPLTSKAVQAGKFVLEVDKRADEFFTKNATNREEFFEQLVQNNKKVVEDLMKKAGLTIKDIDKFVMYNLGRKVRNKIVEPFNVALKDTSCYLAEQYGHMGPVDMFLNLKMMLQDKKIEKGDRVVLFSVGSGMSWGTALIQF